MGNNLLDEKFEVVLLRYRYYVGMIRHDTVTVTKEHLYLLTFIFQIRSNLYMLVLSKLKTTIRTVWHTHCNPQYLHG